MAINFPPQTEGGAKPLDGTIWAAPNGQQWQYDAAIDAWRALGTPSGSGVTYRGPIDLTQDPAAQYANIVAGDFFVVETGDNPVQAFYPGIAGSEVLEGMEVIFDGIQYAAIGNLVPYATTTIAGKIEIATQQEVNEGTNTQTAVTPATLHDWANDEYQPVLPVGTDGQYLGHNLGSPSWMDLPKATEQVEGIVELASRSFTPNFDNYFTYYYLNGGTQPNPLTDTFSESIAVTPYSIAEFLDNVVYNLSGIYGIFDQHVGIGGQPTLPNGTLATHPVVTDTDEGFMSPAQKQQLEQNTDAIADLVTEVDDLKDKINPPLGEVGDLMFGFYRDGATSSEEVYPYGSEFVLDTEHFLVAADNENISGIFDTDFESGPVNYDKVITGTWRCLGKGHRVRVSEDQLGRWTMEWHATLWRRIA